MRQECLALNSKSSRRTFVAHVSESEKNLIKDLIFSNKTEFFCALVKEGKVL